MRLPHRRLSGFLVLITVCGPCLAGCEALSPTQLWKLNRHPRESYGGDAYFSIPSGHLAPHSAARVPQSTEIPKVPAF
jgi:hypothetical protein